MIRAICTLTLGLAAATILTATPVFAQKTGGGSTPVIETEKAARMAVSVNFACQAFGVNNYTTCSTDYVIPAGMRLVLQDIMISARSFNGTLNGYLSYTLDGQPNNMIVAPTRTAAGVAWAAREVPLFVDSIDYLLIGGGDPNNVPLLYATAYLVKK